MAATVKIKGYSDTTTSILIPQVVKPEVTLHFRPHSSYAGEYGFDWMRLGDTCLDGDIDYKNYVGRYGYQETGSDPEDVFTAKLKNYETLENEYMRRILIKEWTAVENQ